MFINYYLFSYYKLILYLVNLSIIWISIYFLLFTYKLTNLFSRFSRFSRFFRFFRLFGLFFGKNLLGKYNLSIFSERNPNSDSYSLIVLRFSLVKALIGFFINCIQSFLNCSLFKFFLLVSVLQAHLVFLETKV